MPKESNQPADIEVDLTVHNHPPEGYIPNGTKYMYGEQQGGTIFQDRPNATDVYRPQRRFPNGKGPSIGDPYEM